MNQGNKYLQDKAGNNSSSRLNASIVIIGALAIAGFSVVITALKNPENLIAILPASGSFFIMVAGSAMYFLYQQKRTEEKP